MGYNQYIQETLSVRKSGENPEQYNIMVLVGNGFDISVLKHYKAITTQYENFYHFLKMKGLGKHNCIIQQIELQKEKMKTAGEQETYQNWSDVEECVELLDNDPKIDRDELKKALSEIQREFSEFLNYVVNSSLLSKLNEEAANNEWARYSLTMFLEDIRKKDELKKIKFGMKHEWHNLYNFYFVNFNFTSLLDNYLYLDQQQFDPHPHKGMDTNISFNTNPNLFEDDVKTPWNYESSSYLAMDIVHPHGYQDVPRSLLFGTGFCGNPVESAAKLSKQYWSQVEIKYRHLFDDTTVFIIFGCSLGKTDKWWWKHIADTLLKNDVNEDKLQSLLIYWWNECGNDDEKVKNDVLEIFFTRADIQEESQKKRLKERICVLIFHSDVDHTFLGLLPKEKQSPRNLNF